MALSLTFAVASLSSSGTSQPSLSFRAGAVSAGDRVVVRLSHAQPKHRVRIFLVQADSLHLIDSATDPRLRTVGDIFTDGRGSGALAFKMPTVSPDVFGLLACCRAGRFVRGAGLLAIRSEPPPGFGVIGASGCSPPSPRNSSATPGGLSENEVFGTGVGGELWTLFILPSGSAWASSAMAAIQGVVNKQVKIVFKFDGGADGLYAVAPSGIRVQPIWGPEPHGSSNWARPGAEWGAGFLFDQPGCWRIHVKSGQSFGDIWLDVQS